MTVNKGCSIISFAIAEKVFFYVREFTYRIHLTEVFKMAGKAGVRDKLTLSCDECKRRNYQTYKSKRNNPDRLELKKFCPFCRKHTSHKETK